jgi:dTDP-4-dehydrorhamnose 3,5-epimerase
MSNSTIHGVHIEELESNSDDRGHLIELFREDEGDPYQYPAMGYISWTHSGISRGPHEHLGQTDTFLFFEGAPYMLYLWDNRAQSPTYGAHIAVVVGGEAMTRVIVPPGVVHGYKNIGDHTAAVLNFPNQLYAGWDREAEVDEIRHEANEVSPFVID